jgi:transposase InsO family protein
LENHTSRKIRTLRSNNGSEYTLKAFKGFGASVGIKKELNVPYNPHQNRVEERNNRAIIGTIKAMLYDQDLPRILWVEA